MDSNRRFSDDNYKNWLKAAESLCILRNNIRDFVENETETYHKSLQENLPQHLKGKICNRKCEFKKGQQQQKSNLCDTCEQWKKAILCCRGGKSGGVHWENCRPSLWPTEKWEVAKVYMPRGQAKHCSFDQFDISAILNFMKECQYFKNFFQSGHLLKIISMRNMVMHSPDFRLNGDELKNGVDNVLKLAELLKCHGQVSNAIQKFNAILETYPGQGSQVDSKTENIQLLDREQQALKEKIEFLAQRCSADQHEDIKGELLGMKTFLDQNKDLLENLRPQLNRLDEIQERVKDHEVHIGQLSDRVDDLEKATLDPMFTNDTLQFKNHLIEQTRKRKWNEPIFSEEHEATGFRGRVEVNGHTFEGIQVCKSKKIAHQEVAKIALDFFKNECESIEEPSSLATLTITSAATPSVISSTSSSSLLFFGTVTVVLNKEICSNGFMKKEEAIESAYSKVALLFALNDLVGDNTFRKAVLEHFEKYYVQVLEEFPEEQDKIFCKLQIKKLTFTDKDGATTKKKAEQQVAKVALQQLSALFNCCPLDVPNENYKGFLKERLEALSMDSPEYITVQKKATEELESLSCSRDPSHNPNTQTRPQEQGDASLELKDSSAVQSLPAAFPSCAATTRDSSPSFIPNNVSKEDYAEIYSLLTVHHLSSPSVTVKCFSTDENFSLTLDITLDKLTFKNTKKYTSKKDAIGQTYYLLGRALGILQDKDENKATMLVKQDFTQKFLIHPKQIVDGNNASFCCSLEEISYNLIYEGQGPTEAEAKQDALQKALSTLPILFGHEDLPKSSDTKKNEEQFNVLLRNAGQKDLTFSHECCQLKISVTLQFQDYIMTSKMQRTKKENCNLLCKRILGLLGVEKEPQCPSLRNCVDEWFIQKGLPQPEFKDTEEANGCKAVFSVQLSCTHPDWEDNLEAAKTKLVQELKERFKNLIDRSEED